MRGSAVPRAAPQRLARFGSLDALQAVAMRVVELNSKVGARRNARGHQRGAFVAVTLADALGGLLDSRGDGVEEGEEALGEVGLALLAEEILGDEKLESVENAEKHAFDWLGERYGARIHAHEVDENGDKLERVKAQWGRLPCPIRTNRSRGASSSTWTKTRSHRRVPGAAFSPPGGSA